MSQDLDKLKTAIDQLIETVNENKESTKKGKSNNWIVALVIGIFAFLLTAVFGFLAWRRGKEVAKLKHAAALADEAKHQASIDLELSANKEERDKALEAAAMAEQQAHALQEALARANGDHARAIQTLEAIISWDDVDTYLGRK